MVLTHTLPSVSDWDNLNDNELREQIINSISDPGGWSSWEQTIRFIPGIYNQISNDNLKKRVNKILLQLTDDVHTWVGERAIYICSEIPLEGIREKLINILQTVQNIFKSIDVVKKLEDCMNEISYIMQLNIAIGKLQINEGKDFLLKQLTPLKKPAPPPLTKEYYLYHMSAKSALKALREINPELVKEYKIK
jgi:hypothetical protein